MSQLAPGDGVRVPHGVHVMAEARLGAGCFNTGYVGQPGADVNTRATGKWSDLQLMQVGPSRHKVTRVGFPDTLVLVG